MHMAKLKIYQLKDTAENRDRRWLDYNSLGKLGEAPEIRNYEKVYETDLKENLTPEQVFQQYNLNHPEGFKGHSPSTSDILVFQDKKSTHAYYIDRFSFVRVPEIEKEIAALESDVKPEVVGYLKYLDSGEEVSYTDPASYIAAYKDDLYSMGPNTVRAITLTQDLNVRYEIEKLLVGEFGETLPDKKTWIAERNQAVSQIELPAEESEDEYMEI